LFPITDRSPRALHSEHRPDRSSARLRSSSHDRIWKATSAVAGLALVGVIVVAVTSVRHQPAVRFPAAAPIALASGATAPDFSLPRLGGGTPVSLSGFRGTPVVLNFFASWCAHCLPELPALGVLARSEAGRVAVVGVDSNDPDLAAAERALASAGATYPVAVDAKAEISTQYLLTALPATYVVGADGRVLGARFGAQDAGSLADWIGELVTGSAPRSAPG